jgi:glycosyltransferase involved in cell wall biosynthesis
MPTDHPDDDPPRRLRVLRVYHSGVVGAWRRRDRALAAEGVEVTLVSAQRWDEGGQVVALEPEPDEQVVATATVGHHPYRFAYDPRPLWRTLRRGRFDVIDIHEEPASLATAEVLVLARLAGVRAPVCLYSAQNIAKRYPVPFRWFEAVALRQAAAVHTCNEAAGVVLRAKGFEGRLENLGLGVDPAVFVTDPAESGATPDAGDATGRLHVGYVGRLEAHKGVAGLIDAVAGLPLVTLDVVGDGPDRVALEARAARLGLVDRVTFSGFRPSGALPQRYATFDVLAVPSLETPGWIEQFGRVVVEAMAAGVPVVASASGSLTEVVGDAGVLVPPGDVPALTGALAELAAHPEERRRLAAAAPARAARWSWPAIARRQADLYREVAV